MEHSKGNPPALGGVVGGGSPFDAIRRMDEYGREYWDGRDLMPLMDYARWQSFEEVVKKARDSLALVEGEEIAKAAFAQVSQLTQMGNLGRQERRNYKLTRFAAYLTAMAGDDTKQAVAEARVYFAVRTREAELTALTAVEVRQTALARAREMVDYRTFRDMMAENAPDYEPSSPATNLFFAVTQNKLYQHITGMDARQIRGARPINTWPGREEGKPEPSPKSAARKVAKNFLTAAELRKLNRLVGRLCLRAEDVADDGLHLTLVQWDHLLASELAMDGRRAISA